MAARRPAHASASGTPTGAAMAMEPGLLFASNQSQTTVASSTLTVATGGAAATRPLMDYQHSLVEGEGLLSLAAKRKSRRLVYMCGICASLTSILLGYDVRVSCVPAPPCVCWRRLRMGPECLVRRWTWHDLNRPTNQRPRQRQQQVGIMSVARRYVDGQLSLTNVQSEVVMGSLNLIAAFGGLIAGKAADRFGRNRAIALACLIFLTGSACMTLAWNFRVLLLGRVITVGGCGWVCGH